MQKAVIIGTGAGGLTATITLAKAGFEVVALERERQIGGFLNPFARRHYHFDPGVHYVGSAGPGESLHHILSRVGVDATELLAPMDPDGFDVFRFPGLEVKCPAGLDRYEARLVGLFPEERDALGKFFRDLRGLRSLLERKHRTPIDMARGGAVGAMWLNQTFGQVLSKRFKSQELRSVLAAQCGDVGLPPNRLPAVLGAGVFLHFAEGGYFPRGGSGAMRDALVNEAKKHGAVFKKRTGATRIETKNGKVVAVHADNGERFECDVVVSAIDPSLTYGKLLDATAVPRRIQKKVDRHVPSIASLCLFFGLEKSLEPHGLGANNVWDYPSFDIDGDFAKMERGETDEHFFFLSPNSQKDPTGTMAPEGCSTLEVVTLYPFAPFAKWQGKPSFKRGEDYEAAKQAAAEKLQASVEKRWPGLISDIAVQDVATPVTNIHFAGAVDGGIYGPAAIKSQFALNAYRPKGPVDGLYVAGAGVMGPGVSTCLASGLTAGKLASREKRQKAFPVRMLEAALNG